MPSWSKKPIVMNRPSLSWSRPFASEYTGDASQDCGRSSEWLAGVFVNWQRLHVVLSVSWFKFNAGRPWLGDSAPQPTIFGHGFLSQASSGRCVVNTLSTAGMMFVISLFAPLTSLMRACHSPVICGKQGLSARSIMTTVYVQQRDLHATSSSVTFNRPHDASPFATLAAH